MIKSRHDKTLSFLKKQIGQGRTILDLGTPNTLSKAMTNMGYSVVNTKGEDLDIDFHRFGNTGVDVITAFEIFEHLLAPFNVLSVMDAPELVASVPLKLWFAPVYWNDQDIWDCHYHEFDSRQFDMLMKTTGWEIIAFEKWKSPDPKKLGIRPLLRWFTDRYYIVHCRRMDGYPRKN